LLGAASVLVLSDKVTTPLPWLRLDAIAVGHPNPSLSLCFIHRILAEHRMGSARFRQDCEEKCIMGVEGCRMFHSYFIRTSSPSTTLLPN